MMVLITYDVNCETEAGRRRLRLIGKECVNYGQRVQNSVFECVLQYGTFMLLKKRLIELMDKNTDSLRFYSLGNNYKTKVEHVGAKPGYDPEGFLMI
ncbi:MAG: CRISPR-associated endonuclease Cas2 [Clostridiales bacterium]|jgi:CRISPR-associated protein Cas2|nr:CRISPR-associated endonuclease Cas2 [Clostridiales bacterium]